jgi:hypothetical protein
MLVAFREPKGVLVNETVFSQQRIGVPEGQEGVVDE